MKSSRKREANRRSERPEEHAPDHVSDEDTAGRGSVTVGRDGEEATPRVRTGPQCSARRTNGLPCKNAPMKGSVVCARHGGLAPQVKKKAKERLMELVHPAISELYRILHNPETDDAVKVRAATAILDRTGFRPGMVLQVEPGDKWADLLDEAGGFLDRSLPGGDDPAAIVRSDVENAIAVGEAAREEAWNRVDDEDRATDDNAKLRFDPETVVRGETVNDSRPHAPSTNGTRQDAAAQARYESALRERLGDDDT